VSSYANRNLLSVGALLMILVVSLVLGGAGLVDWWYVPPLIIALCGCWLLVLAWMQSSNPEKYGRGAFSFLGWGLLLVAFGGAWFFYGFGWYYSLALVLLVVAAVAIAAAFRRK